MSKSTGENQQLASLFQRQWFRRAWIVQEAVLPRILLMYLGDKYISWHQLGQLAEILNQLDNRLGADSGSKYVPLDEAAVCITWNMAQLSKWRRIRIGAVQEEIKDKYTYSYLGDGNGNQYHDNNGNDGDKDEDGDKDDKDDDELEEEDDDNDDDDDEEEDGDSINDEEDGADSQRNGSNARLRFNLRGLVRDFWTFKSSDPRDKIYAYYGLINLYATTQNRQVPNYHLSTATVYALATMKQIEDRGNLEILSCCLFQLKSQVKERLPSWVPDYSQSGINPFPSNVDASKGFTYEPPEMVTIPLSPSPSPSPSPTAVVPHHTHALQSKALLL